MPSEGLSGASESRLCCRCHHPPSPPIREAIRAFPDVRSKWPVRPPVKGLGERLKTQRGSQNAILVNIAHILQLQHPSKSDLIGLGRLVAAQSLRICLAGQKTPFSPALGRAMSSRVCGAAACPGPLSPNRTVGLRQAGGPGVPLGPESYFLNQHEGDDGCRWQEMKNVNFAADLLPRGSTLLGYDRPKEPDWATKSKEPITWPKS